MAFIRRKKVDGRSYYYLVENYRERVDDRSVVRQRVIRYVGSRRPRGPQKGLLGIRVLATAGDHGG